jgi:predicted RNA-binding Zn-ribbon protein involved in translation (DUF1610 family)
MTAWNVLIVKCSLHCTLEFIKLFKRSVHKGESVMISTFPCPRCKEYHYHRSHTRNLYERLRRRAFKQRPYRCHSCGYRGWEKTSSLNRQFSGRTFLLYLAILAIAIIAGLLAKSVLM